MAGALPWLVPAVAVVLLAPASASAVSHEAALERYRPLLAVAAAIGLAVALGLRRRRELE